MYEKMGKSPIYQAMVSPPSGTWAPSGTPGVFPAGFPLRHCSWIHEAKKIIRMLKWILNHCDDTSKLLDNLVMFKSF